MISSFCAITFYTKTFFKTLLQILTLTVNFLQSTTHPSDSRKMLTRIKKGDPKPDDRSTSHWVTRILLKLVLYLRFYQRQKWFNLGHCVTHIYHQN